MAGISSYIPHFIKERLFPLIGLIVIGLVLLLAFGKILITVLMIAVVAVVALIGYRLFHKKTSDTFGSARHATPQELERLRIIQDPVKDRLKEGEMIIGEARTSFLSRLFRGVKYIILNQALAAMHLLIIGRTGAGKTFTILAPNIVRASFNESLFISDVKKHKTKPRGELWEMTSAYRKNAIYFAPMEPERNQLKFNWIPLLIRPDGSADVGRAQLYARAVVMNGEKAGENSYWNTSAADLLAAIWLHVAKCNEPHPLAAFHILNGSDDEFLTKLLEDSPCREAAFLASQYIGADDRAKSSYVGTARNAFNFMQISEIQEFTYTFDRTDFRKMREKSISIYYQMRPNQTKILAPLSCLILTVLFDQLETTPGHTIKFLLDEFANFGQIPDFDKKITTLRSAGMPILACVQTFTSQIEGIYGKAAGETTVGNFVTKTAFSGLDYEDTKPISDGLGDLTIVQDTTSRRIGKVLEGTKSTHMHGRPLMTPDEIKTMPRTQMLIFKSENTDSFFADRINYNIVEKAKETEFRAQREPIPERFFTKMRLPPKPKKPKAEMPEAPKMPEMPEMPQPPQAPQMPMFPPLPEMPQQQQQTDEQTEPTTPAGYHDADDFWADVIGADDQTEE